MSFTNTQINKPSLNGKITNGLIKKCERLLFVTVAYNLAYKQCIFMIKAEICNYIGHLSFFFSYFLNFFFFKRKKTFSLENTVTCPF